MKKDVNLAVKRAKSRVREESSSSTSRGKISKFSLGNNISVTWRRSQRMKEYLSFINCRKRCEQWTCPSDSWLRRWVRERESNSHTFCFLRDAISRVKEGKERRGIWGRRTWRTLHFSFYTSSSVSGLFFFLFFSPFSLSKTTTTTTLYSRPDSL